MATNSHIHAIEARIIEIESWLDDEAPYARFDQLHLDSGTPERAYWHLGYVTALIDLIAYLTRETEDNAGNAIRSHEGDPDD